MNLTLPDLLNEFAQKTFENVCIIKNYFYLCIPVANGAVL